MQSRLEEIFSGVLFMKVAKEFPEFRNKVVAIQGDIDLKNIGLSVADRTLLIEKVIGLKTVGDYPNISPMV